jgi:hypothetical protein
MQLKKILLTLSVLASFSAFAQDDLEKMLLDEMDKPVDYAVCTFLSSRMLNSHSTELVGKKGIGFRVSHKFGLLNNGAEHFFGFDDANSLLEANYAIADWWNVGIGRATLDELISGYSKFRVLRQSTGARTMPVSMTFVAQFDYKTRQYDDAERDKNQIDRFDYTTQILLARKINSRFSAQVMPTYIHRNLVETTSDLNNIGAVGFGATYKIKKQFGVNAEYYWVQEHNTASATYYSPVSLGICYQTSRHNFELFATNAQGVTDDYYIASTTNNFFKGEIRVGFNVSTVFTLGRKEKTE